MSKDWRDYNTLAAVLVASKKLGRQIKENVSLVELYTLNTSGIDETQAEFCTSYINI